MSPELHRLNLMRTENLSYSYLYSCSAQSRCSLRTDRMKKYKKPLVRYTIVDLWGILRYFINAWGGKFTLRRMLKTLFLLLLISYYLLITYYLPSLVAQTVKHLPTMWETWVQSLGQENPLEKESTPVFLPGKSHGLRRLVGYSPRVAKSRTRLSNFTFFLSSLYYLLIQSKIWFDLHT